MNAGNTGGTSRRRFLTGLATVTTATVTSLAGCSGGGEDDGEAELPTEPNYKGWFGNVGNYNGTKDRRDQDQTTVEVGVQANNGYLGFGPAAIAITPGTEVEWDWTGQGGAHNVVSEAGLFDSGEPVRAGETPFAHTFERPGVFRFVCEPHAGIGMKGAVFVALE